jgi:hypothetical protein
MFHPCGLFVPSISASMARDHSSTIALSSANSDPWRSERNHEILHGRQDARRQPRSSMTTRKIKNPSVGCKPLSSSEPVQEQQRPCRPPFYPCRLWHPLRPLSQSNPSFRSSPSHLLRRCRLSLRARPVLPVVQPDPEQAPQRQLGMPEAQPPSVGHMRSMRARKVLRKMESNISS